MPSTEAKLLTIAALVAYATAALLALIDRRAQRDATRRPGLLLLAAGISFSLATLVLRVARGHSPTSSGLDTFTLLAVLTGAATGYLKATNALPQSDLALVPLAAVWSLLAVVTGEAYQDFTPGFWNVTHVLLAVGASVSFAAAAASGWLYLRKHKQLRGKDPAVFKWPLPSLERLDRFTRHVLPVSFALVTATIVAGLPNAFRRHGGSYFGKWVTHPKILLATVTWVLYTFALHAAYAKRFRGRAVAIFAIVAFVLLAAVLIASILLPAT